MSNPKTYEIYHDLGIKTTIQKAFEAVAQPMQLINWWPLKCSGTAERGGAYNFFFTEEYDWYGQVTEYLPGKSFHIKMTQSDEDWNPTSFGFDFVELEEGVQVQFWHKGWQSCNDHFRRTSYCWAMLLHGLKLYLEEGIIIPFKDRS